MLNGDTNAAFQIGFQPNDTAILSIENVDPTGLGEFKTSSDEVTTRLRGISRLLLWQLTARRIYQNHKTENITIFGNVEM